MFGSGRSPAPRIVLISSLCHARFLKKKAQPIYAQNVFNLYAQLSGGSIHVIVVWAKSYSQFKTVFMQAAKPLTRMRKILYNLYSMYRNIFHFSKVHEIMNVFSSKECSGKVLELGSRGR